MLNNHTELRSGLIKLRVKGAVPNFLPSLIILVLKQETLCGEIEGCKNLIKISSGRLAARLFCILLVLLLLLVEEEIHFKMLMRFHLHHDDEKRHIWHEDREESLHFAIITFQGIFL